MKDEQPEVGDMIRIERPGYHHIGIFIGSESWFGGPYVVHNKKGDGVVCSTLAEFADGCRVIVHRKATGDRWQRMAIAERASSLVGQKYDLIKFNCEHAAHLAQTGRAESPQIAGWVFLLLAVGGLALLGRKG